MSGCEAGDQVQSFEDAVVLLLVMDLVRDLLRSISRYLSRSRLRVTGLYFFYIGHQYSHLYLYPLNDYSLNLIKYEYIAYL